MTPEEVTTPEEIAQRIVDNRFCGAPYMSAYAAPDLVADIAAAIRDAYERAAQVAETTAGGHYMAQVSSTTIRKQLKGDK